MTTKKDKSNNKTLLGSLGVLGVLALKFKFYILAAWKALALVKIGWILSPLITIGVYAMIFGLPYAVAVFVVLVTHEMGHWIWMKALGLDPKMPVFLPFIAYTAMTKLPPDQATHAWVAMAGPLVGGVVSGVLFWFGVNSRNTWLMAAGSTGFFLNLFQLIPAKPFDGGFIINAISKWLLVPGTVLLFGLAYYFQSIFLFIISILSLVSLFGQLARERALRQYKESTQSRYGYVPENPGTSIADPVNAASQAPTITAANQNQTGSVLPLPTANYIPASMLDQMTPATTEQRVLITIAYLGLIALLSYLYWLSSNELIVFMPHHK